MAFVLYVREDILVFLLKAEDFDVDLEETDNDPEVEEWAHYVAQFKREGFGIDTPEEV